MKLLVCVLLLLFEINCAKGDIVDEYVINITKLINQSIHWRYPRNYLDFIGDFHPTGERIYDGEFDFIVVGAGSGGSVVGGRLSEEPGWKILLLEAGGYENALTDVPDLTDYLRTTTYNWGYFIEPQEDILQAYIDHRFPFVRGKAIGGTSVVNAMIYVRGNTLDFDEWGKLNPGWSYKDVLPYFIKSEIVSFPNYTRGYHGTNGTLHVEWSRIYDDVGEAFLEAQKQLGRKVVADYNGAPEDQVAFSIIQLTEDLGRRDSGGKAFIYPARNRKNLYKYTGSLVTKILLDGTRAYGVEYVRNGQYHYATTNKEVIVCAGTVNTPQLLMLSGIGPADHLRELGIKVVKDLPAGNNMWDHISYNYQSFQINHYYPDYDIRLFVEEYLNASGPFTTDDDLQCIGFVNLHNASAHIPDVEHVLHVGKPQPEPYEIFKNVFHLTPESYREIILPVINKSQISIHPVLLHPFSRGTIRLKSKSPFEFPILNMNYLNDSRDVETLVRAMKDSVAIANTPAMQKYNTTIIKVVHPVCKNLEYGSDEFWTCMVKALINTLFHLGGTSKMGPEYLNDTVVDAHLRVHGIQNLRISDCSVIPITTSGHTSAVGNMIGEKISDMLKSQYCTKETCNYI